jgi:hypothetical protein
VDAIVDVIYQNKQASSPPNLEDSIKNFDGLSSSYSSYEKETGRASKHYGESCPQREINFGHEDKSL